MKRRRRFDTFSLSFLDIMSCGFGAVILFFVIINTTMAKRSDEINQEASIRAEMLRVEVAEGEENLVELRNTLEELRQRSAEARGRSDRVIDLIRQRREELAALLEKTTARRESVEKLQADLKSLEEESRRLSAAAAESEQEGTGRRVREFTGDGTRQYLTGVRVGGKRVVILLDASASMLDDTVVNVVRRRILPDEQKVRAPKWQRALGTVEWITTQFDPEGQFQIFTFGEEAVPVLPDTAGEWLEAAGGQSLEEAIRAVRRVVPGGGTSLWHAFDALKALNPPPDNLFLITDGLPTQGEAAPRGTTVSGRDRLRHFERAIRELPESLPVNVVLFPMEGDAEAAGTFWKLAIVSHGSFMAPSRDWP